MKYLPLLLLFFFSEISVSQTNAEIIEEIEAYHASENEKFGDKETTILSRRDRRRFKALDFYEVDLEFRVEAAFVRTP